MRQRESSLDSEVDWEPRPSALDPSDEWDDRLVMRRVLGALPDAIASLPPHYRDTIALQAFGELSYDEIAKALDIPLGTVMSRLNGAKRLLREHLGDLVSPSEEANTA